MSGSPVTHSYQLEDLDKAVRTVDPQAVAGLDLAGGNTGAGDTGDAELTSHDGRVRNHTAGVAHNSADDGEERGPRRIGHLAYQNVAVLHLVEFLRRGNDFGNAFDDTGRDAQTLDPALGLRIEAQLLREAPQVQVWELELRLGGGADEVRRSDLLLRGAHRSPLGDDALRVEVLRIADQIAQFVVLQVDGVVGLRKCAQLHQLPTDAEQHHTRVQVGA